MSLNIWIIILTATLTIVPLLKVAKEKRFGAYNLFIIMVGATVVIVSIVKFKRDELTEKNNETRNSDYVKKINKLVNETELVRNDLSNITKSLDSFGLAVDANQGKIVINDRTKLKNIVLFSNHSTNVTSINQKGGQTARDITNNK